MDRRQVERVTSPGIGLAVLVSAVLVVVNPGNALLWVAPAPVVAAVGCLLSVRLSLRMRAPGAAAVFLVEALFWLGGAGYLVSLWLNQS